MSEKISSLVVALSLMALAVVGGNHHGLHKGPNTNTTLENAGSDVYVVRSVLDEHGDVSGRSVAVVHPLSSSMSWAMQQDQPTKGNKYSNI